MRRLTAGIGTAVLLAAGIFVVGAAPAAAATTQDFVYTGSVQHFQVPDGITSIDAWVYGAAGGGSEQLAGAGARVTITLNVVPGQMLDIYVGGKGGTATGQAGAAGGFNGGGAGGNGGVDCCPAGAWGGHGGGGASDIRSGGALLVVAGGGGGAGGYPSYFGTNGGGDGGQKGEAGASSSAGGGGGGTEDGSGGAGGTGHGVGADGINGTAGTGGSGGTGLAAGGGGGGGGYGGGGGGGGESEIPSGGGGGGGGSSLGPASAVLDNHGAGEVYLDWSQEVINASPPEPTQPTATAPVTAIPDSSTAAVAVEATPRFTG